MAQQHQSDILIIGSGIAGLSAALCLADKHHVHILSKNKLCSGASAWAQGGIAASTHHEDALAKHKQDTLTAGANINDKEAVDTIINDSLACINWLKSQGVLFEHDESGPKLRQEGGHSERRIYYVADHTGRAIAQALIAKVLAHPNITYFEYTTAIDLILEDRRCVGTYGYRENDDVVDVFTAQHTIIATGGASKVYLYNSNPDIASGDGIAMAERAGVATEGMAFNQFHPTCLYHPQAKSFLISEALRGEGAKLELPDGSSFMHKFHADGELAPRDIVARAIDFELKRLGTPCVYLNISHRDPQWVKTQFPTIYQTCLSYQIDITKQPIPVVPAAHYTCGGIKTDLNGKTSLDGLYAIGEVAHTGLHGANRLASNSLLECVAMARQVGKHIASASFVTLPRIIKPWDDSKVAASDQKVVVSHCWHSCRMIMWDYVGIVRSHERLARAAHSMAFLGMEINNYYRRFRVNRALIECRNLVMVAQNIIESAQKQSKNVGLHYNTDLDDNTDLEGNCSTPTARHPMD